MGVRLIAGRAGAGKTHWCQARIRETLAESLMQGPALIMLVPEQAAFQMERGLLTQAAGERPASEGAGRCGIRGLGRCEVLSFRRLAYRILRDAGRGTPTALTPLGRQMALRHLIARNRRALREFRDVSERGGFVSGLSRTIVELMQEAVVPDALRAAADAAERGSDPSSARLADVALLYQSYLDYLGQERVDAEGVLDLARGRLDGAAWLAGARVWVDGFAGFAQQQMRMLVALAGRAAEVNVSLLVDPDRIDVLTGEAPPDDLSLYARTERTWLALSKAIAAAGVQFEESVLLGAKRRVRFEKAPALMRLERELFQARGSSQSAETVDATASLNRSSQSQIRLICAVDRRAEVEAAVAALVDLVKRPGRPLRYRDIAIIVRDIEPYHDLLSATLAAHGVPSFIDRRRPTHHHPLIEFVRAILSLSGGGSFGDGIIRLLKTGLSGLDADAADALENYVLAQGLIGAAAWDEDWTHPVTTNEYWRRRDDEDAEAEEPEVGAEARSRKRGLTPREKSRLDAVVASREFLRQRLGAWWPTAASPKAVHSCQHWVESLFAVLTRFDVARQIARWCDEAKAEGRLGEAAEHEQVWTDLMKLFDEMVAALSEARMGGRQFQDVLESGLAEFSLGLVPATLDQVLVSSIERSRHPPIRAAFVLGFGDGLFPARISEDVILGDDERLSLERGGVAIGRSRVDRLLDERMLAYIALTRASEFLWVSYPESDERGRPLEASPFWPAVATALGDVAEERIERGRPEQVASASALTGGLAMNLREWSEAEDQGSGVRGQGAGGRDQGWLELYEWARGEAALKASLERAFSGFVPTRKAELSPEAVASLWPTPHRTSVTRLETFAACPFKHFARYGLRLRERAVHEISRLDFGVLYHLVLQQFVNEMIEGGRTLADMSPAEIAGTLSRLGETLLPQLAERVRLDEPQRRRTLRRGRRELHEAVRGEQSLLSERPLRKLVTEAVFGADADARLPALVLHTSSGREVQVSGKIDRVDVVPHGDARLAVVFDYKLSLQRRLRLDEAYHGLALQLLTYLLVLREHGKNLGPGELIPGGAFYLPLIGHYEKVDHPEEIEQDKFRAYKSYQPRGVVDFDWIDKLDPKFGAGWCETFSVFRNKEGGLGHADSTDALPRDVLPRLLDHVRAKMTDLVERWLSGDIAVAPSRLGNELPCARCEYGAVCRIEARSREARPFEAMSRLEVINRLSRGDDV